MKRRKRHWIPSGVLRRFNKQRERERKRLRKVLLCEAGRPLRSPVPPLGIALAIIMGVRLPRSFRGRNPSVESLSVARAFMAEVAHEIQP